MESIWKVLLWGLGICVSGFLFLAGWMWHIVSQLSKKVSYDWIENNFQATINKKIDEMNKNLVDIKNALIGDFKSKGLITKVSDIEKNCNFHNEQK